ncbi:ficolin-2-like [Asterias amurensis]|uniref:ficolin-2-like n=1 Tax=Asterias amurensis TaxID=7602 RepID=UPI003AB26EED
MSTLVGFLLVTAALSVDQSSQSCTSNWSYMSRDTADKGKRLAGHLVRNVTGVRSKVECLSFCLKQGSECESINFADKLGICQVNGATRSTHSSDLVDDNDFDYFDPPSSAHWQNSRTYSCSDTDVCFNSGSCTEFCHPPWFRCECTTGFYGEQCTLSTSYDGVASSCLVYKDNGHTVSGVLQIKPDSGAAFDVYCDMDTDGGGWAVFQRRYDGSEEFYRGWSDYVNGFGSLSGEYWLGLEKLYRIAYTTRTLRVDLTDWSNGAYYAQYAFYVHNSNDRYRGFFWSYSGNAGDSLSYHHNNMFSTYDYDGDNSGSNCASTYHGAWWYNSCHNSNLNGKYVVGGSTGETAVSAVWYSLHGHNYCLMQTYLKVR